MKSGIWLSTESWVRYDLPFGFITAENPLLNNLPLDRMFFWAFLDTWKTTSTSTGPQKSCKDQDHFALSKDWQGITTHSVQPHLGCLLFTFSSKGFLTHMFIWPGVIHDELVVHYMCTQRFTHWSHILKDCAHVARSIITWASIVGFIFSISPGLYLVGSSPGFRCVDHSRIPSGTCCTTHCRPSASHLLVLCHLFWIPIHRTSQVFVGDGIGAFLHCIRTCSFTFFLLLSFSNSAFGFLVAPLVAVAAVAIELASAVLAIFAFHTFVLSFVFALLTFASFLMLSFLATFPVQSTNFHRCRPLAIFPSGLSCKTFGVIVHSSLEIIFDCLLQQFEVASNHTAACPQRCPDASRCVLHNDCHLGCRGHLLSALLLISSHLDFPNIKGLQEVGLLNMGPLGG